MSFFGDLGWRRAGVIGLAAFIVLTGCAVSKRSSPQTINSSVSAADVERNSATFDAAWRIVNETHYDTNFNGVDWEAVRRQLRPKAEAAQTVSELRRVINQMLGRLGQSHMALIPSDVANAFDPKLNSKTNRLGKGNSSTKTSREGSEKGRPKSVSQAAAVTADARKSGPGDGDIGVEVRLIDQRIVVTRVDPQGPADRAGIRPGWILKSLDGEELSERLGKLPKDIEARKAQFLAWRMAQGMLAGQPGSSVSLQFLDGSNSVTAVELQRRKQPGELVKFGLMPPMYAQLDSGWAQSKSGARAGMIRFNLWLIPIAAPFDRAVDQFRQGDGIIIDLRGNLGGIGGMIMGLSGHFLTERISLGTMKMRTNEIHFFANPRWVNAAGERVVPFSGPVAVLTDSISLSAAEVFAGGMQSIGRARVFGETTGGQALPAVWDRLPNGDVLYHAFADFVTSTGVRLEGRGVIPDERRPLSRTDLLTGRDPALEAALEWIGGEKKKHEDKALLIRP